MIFSLLSVSTPPAINIGDYIQALAARQFLPRVDSYVERERLKDYDGEVTNVIMNAYYMHDGRQWPPSDRINPLFVAVHINSLVREEMLSNEGVAYFKKYEPIGCRDRETERFLLSKGINAYFSGCLTLTLGNKYKSVHRSGKVYIVDVGIPVKGRVEQFKLLLWSVFHIKQVNNITKKINSNKGSLRQRIREWCRMSKFYKHFSKIADTSLLYNAEYLTQEDETYNELKDNDERMSAAEDLVKKYSEASLVITSRIHCALPCLAVETPVYYVFDDNMPEYSKCRLDGLYQLFNVIHWTGEELLSDLFNYDNKITLNNITPNKKDYLLYADNLSERCRTFIEHLTKE